MRFILEVAQSLTPASRLLDAGIEVLVTASSFCIVTGTKLMFARPLRFWPAGAGSVVVVLAVVSGVLSPSPTLELAASISGFLYAGGLFVWVGVMFIQRTLARRAGGRTTGILFLLWGVHKLDYPFIHALPGISGAAYLFAH